jgi:demethylmenaquinone methyltransferase/2-methoxy-6-polyprenyl-1,4-benzoquinol methylase
MIARLPRQVNRFKKKLQLDLRFYFKVRGRIEGIYLSNWRRLLSNLTGVERERYVRAMFTRIAYRYDLMNRLMTAGQDIRWRDEVIRRAALPPGGRLLDLGSGTGDLARQALRQYPDSRVLAADFTLEMMRVGRSRNAASLDWSCADALNLPLPANTFDAVVSGFLMRNVVDVPGCLAEQYRLLKPGGRIVILDTTPPPHNGLSPVIRFHLHTVIPVLGRLLTGQADAYTYLPDSTEGFLEPEQMAEGLQAVGFRNVAFHRRMFATVAIYWGVK